MTSVDPTGLFVLPSDVVLSPVSRLPTSMRRRLESFRDGFVITRPRGRAPSQVFDEATAELVETFRRPARITDALREVCGRRGLDPRRTLAAVFPVLDALVTASFLVPVDSPDAEAIVPTLVHGDRIGPFLIVSAAKIVGDVEVFQARMGHRTIALKLARPDASGLHADLLAREAAVLRRLAGRGAPALLDHGEIEGSAFVAMEWVRGASPVRVADELRATLGGASPGADRRVLDLCRAITSAYAHLHRAGVVHGDVNPGNVLVGVDGRVTLLDFGLARLDGAPPVVRGGVAEYQAPESGLTDVPRGTELDARSEQYALAVLLDRLVSGRFYLDFSPLEGEFRRQLREDPPRSFAARGGRPWPEMEAALARALSKDPHLRFPSISDLAEALAGIAPRPGHRSPPSDLPKPARLVGRMQEISGIHSELFSAGPRPSPTCSVAFGGAGIAYFWYRAACLQDDPEALATARAWLSRSRRHEGDLDAFDNPGVGLTAETLGPASPYHAPAGLHTVGALVAHAASETSEVVRHVDRFLECSVERGSDLDVFTGSVGTIHAAAGLATLPLLSAYQDRIDGLRALAADEAGRAWRALETMGPMDRCSTMPTPGIAHGWGGVLHGLLRYHVSFGAPPPAGLEGRLHELAAQGETAERGLRWRDELGRGDAPLAGSGWCNGSAGLVFLWTLAYRLFQDSTFLDLAERTAWNAWEGGASRWNLCCGYTGRAYACLDAFRHLGDPAWRDRAVWLAQRAWRALESVEEPAGTAYPHSLFRGVFGPALLVLDLERPLEARMPFFGSERWS